MTTGPAERTARATYTEATAALASCVLDALRGVGDTAPLARFAETASDPKAALAAVRVLGADVLAPYALTGGSPHPRDLAVISQAAAVFPAPVFTAPPPEGPIENWAIAWRDWATDRLIAALGDAAARESPRPPTGETLTDATDWPRWAAGCARLAPLTLPGVGGPVPAAVRRHPVPLARATTRALLRRDYPTAARLLRWLAAAQRDGVTLALEPDRITEHIALHAAGEPRLALDLAVARLLLGRTA
ncbi:hypothetical protein SUDANB171_01208 [Streptomyces sp. enrichment culture]|uniref:hypothetical protein n=1 Tax=Streptomyces xiamenensis TaxID=408015 RepID=UPI0036ED2A92